MKKAPESLIQSGPEKEKTLSCFIWENMERPVKQDFIQAFKAKFGYTSGSTVTGIFKYRTPTINQLEFLREFLRKRDFLSNLENAYADQFENQTA